MGTLKNSNSHWTHSYHALCQCPITLVAKPHQLHKHRMELTSKAHLTLTTLQQQQATVRDTGRGLQNHRFHPYAQPSTHMAAPAQPTAWPAPTWAAPTSSIPVNIPAAFQSMAGRTPLPTTAAELYNDVDQDIDQKVKAILDSTAHNLAIKGKKICYPHNYVLRGEKKERMTISTLTIAEHCWAILRIIEDANLPAEYKPALVTHLDEVQEDAHEYPWPNVRRWSEEVFTRIGEKRLKWSEENKIQMLRVSFSRTGTTLTSQSTVANTGGGSGKGNTGSGRATTANSKEQLRGGPPCKEFNSGACTQQGGHMVEGRRRPHICSYCIRNFSSIHTHAEKDCDIKKRQNTTQGKRQHFRD